MPCESSGRFLCATWHIRPKISAKICYRLHSKHMCTTRALHVGLHLQQYRKVIITLYGLILTSVSELRHSVIRWWRPTFYTAGVIFCSKTMENGWRNYVATTDDYTRCIHGSVVDDCTLTHSNELNALTMVVI